ncbi:hypothetical protein BH10BAC3_BH10BAC3_23020 [soil metagenome]
MKTSLLYILLITAVLYAGFSCQKELSGDPVGNAVGILDTDIDGGCLPMGIYGPYITNGNFSDLNYIEAPVTITKPGAFVIYTDTINGFYFKANGSFSTTGSYKIKLNATGKPMTAGQFDFSIFFGTTTCRTTVTVRSDTSTNGPAEFTFAGAPGKCSLAILSGDFIKGKLFDNSSTVTVKINVTRTGTYTLSTTSINGYRFTGYGTINAIGPQTITLIASGTPIHSGKDNFSFNSNIPSCSFRVEVLATATNNDHFPLTGNSFWNYDDLLNPGDTINRTIVDSVLIGNVMYKQMNEQHKTGAPLEHFYRKSGNDYFEYTSVDNYTSAVSYVPSVNDAILFLKENLSTGDTWKTIEYNGISVATGKPMMLQYVFTCADADANLYLNGITYQHVYNVIMQAFTKPDAAVPYASTREINNFFYAKGIGLIYSKKTNEAFNRIEIKIRNWQVK